MPSSAARKIVPLGRRAESTGARKGRRHCARSARTSHHSHPRRPGGPRIHLQVAAGGPVSVRSLSPNMSHELRTPLAAVLGYAELMQEGFYGTQSEKSMDAL